MRAVALDLPGGQWSIDELRRMTVALEEQAEKRRYVFSV
jgi:hypothetical protein